MAQMQKNPKSQTTQKSQKTLDKWGLFYKITKIWKTEIFAFCIITFEPIKIQTCSAPQNDRQNLSFVKDINVDWKKIG